MSCYASTELGSLSGKQGIVNREPTWNNCLNPNARRRVRSLFMQASLCDKPCQSSSRIMRQPRSTLGWHRDPPNPTGARNIPQSASPQWDVAMIGVSHAVS